MRRPDPLDRTIERAPWTIRHVERPQPDRLLFPRALAVLAVCVVLLLANGLGGAARSWIGQFFNQHFQSVPAGDRNGLIQPERAR
jgi:hypothetical protein